MESTCEKLSIRDSAKSLKKYGSTSKHVTRNQNYFKHIISRTDTLQGISLKYGVSTEQIRRANRLWATDSLFLREYLMIPVLDNNSVVPVNVEPATSPTAAVQVASPSSVEDFDISDFLGKIDSSIANTKEEVKKARGNSEFASNLEFHNERRKPAVSRMKQIVNNNSNADPLATPQTVVMSHGRKVRTSLQRLEKQQDELFEL